MCTCLYQTDWEGRTYIKKILFDSKEDALRWISEMESLKAMRTGMLDDGGIEDLPREEFNRRSHQWLNQCQAWISLWGIDKVPLDMRLRVQETQDLFGLQRTDFGPDSGSVYQN